MKLVAEKAKYEQFLAQLEKDPGGKPANVVARVKADYTTKLAAVSEQLKSNHDVLTAHAASLTTQLQKLQDAEQRFKDEIAELDLRKEVGELPEEEWETAVARVKADAGKIKSQQEVTAADIKKIRDVLAAGAAVPKTEAPAAKDLDELEFLKAVVGQPTAPTPKATRPTPKSNARTSAPTESRPSVTIKPIGPPPRPSQGTSTAASSAPAPRASVSKLSFIEPDPMAVEAAPVNVEATSSVEPEVPAEKLIEAPQADVKITPRSNSVSKPLASNVPTGELNLKSMGNPNTVKKAKCPKCGKPNVPSDWYCVHCGAELAI